MSKVKKAMQKTGLKYFSQLTAMQKNEVVLNIRILKNKLTSLPKGLAIEILKNKPLDHVLNENQKINDLIKGQKMFYYDALKYWLPLNINKILTDEQ